MKNILVIGAGKIGSVVADLLSQASGAGGAYRVVVADRDPALLAAIERTAPPGPARHAAPGRRRRGRPARRAAGQFAVLSAAPYHLTLRVAEAARDAGVHYLDLTEDVAEHAAHPRAGARARARPSSRSAAWRRASSRSSPTTWRSQFDTLDSRAHARRRPAAYPSQRAELQPHLEHRGRHQRILRALRGDRRRRSCAKCRRWKSARNSRSTASPTRPSTPRAGSARCARRSRARCAR